MRHIQYIRYESVFCIIYVHESCHVHWTCQQKTCNADAVPCQSVTISLHIHVQWFYRLIFYIIMKMKLKLNMFSY